MSTYVEILAFLAFLLTLFTNIIFMAEILFGDSTWTNDLKGKGNTGRPIVLPYAAVVLISCASIAFTLFHVYIHVSSPLSRQQPTRFTCRTAPGSATSLNFPVPAGGGLIRVGW